MGDNLIIVNVDLGETRVAIVEDGMIAELLIERKDQRSPVGNVYRGRVKRVLPGMQAAFVDVGLDRDAFLHVTDLVDPDDLEPLSVGEGEGEAPEGGRRISRRTPIREVIREGESIVVQVSKAPIGTKGCRVTANVSLPGRQLVFMPTGDGGGVSRRISDEKERKRLARLLRRLSPARGALIARTAAEGISASAVESDAAYLVDTWNEILERFGKRRGAGLLYEELDLPLRVARDSLKDSVSELVVDDRACFESLRSFVDRLVPSKLDAIKFYDDDEPIFDAFGIEAEIRRALERVVALPSGGSLVIDQGEALTAVDVNTGKFVGKGSKDQEETILKTNLEAVEEIAYQVRFRNIGGLIVLDLIDMDRPANRRKVMERLGEALKSDRARTSVNEISRFGLLEMTRERTRESLGRSLHEPCLYCDGTGHTLSRVTIANEVLREVRRCHEGIRGDIEVSLHPRVAEVFGGDGAAPLKALEKRIGKRVRLEPDASGHLEHFAVKARRASAGREEP